MIPLLLMLAAAQTAPVDAQDPPPPAPVALASWSVSNRFIVNGEGRVADCQNDIAGEPTGDAPDMCGMSVGQQTDRVFPKPPELGGKPRLGFVDTVVRTDGDTSPEFKFEHPGVKLVALTRMHFDVDTKGNRANCQDVPTGQEGFNANKSSLCVIPFGPYLPAKGKRGATVTVAVFIGPLPDGVAVPEVSVAE